MQRTHTAHGRPAGESKHQTPRVKTAEERTEKRDGATRNSNRGGVGWPWPGPVGGQHRVASAGYGNGKATRASNRQAPGRETRPPRFHG